MFFQKNVEIYKILQLVKYCYFFKNMLEFPTEGTMQRLKSIDIIRGLVILKLILGFHPGIAEHVPPILKHAHWEGCTISDLVFPAFSITMCMLIPYLVDSKIKKGFSSKEIFLYGLKKVITLTVLGIFLNAFPTFNLSTVRIPGVLQRQGFLLFTGIIIYLLVKKLTKERKKQVLILISLAVLIMTISYALIPSTDDLTLVKRVDSFAFGVHTNYEGWDSEGILSTFNSISTALIAIVIGIFLKSEKSNKYKFAFLLISGIILIVLGKSISLYYPMVKRLWTPSFVLFSAGVFVTLYSVILFIIDILGFDKFTSPVLLLSRHSLAIYFFNSISSKVIAAITFREIPVSEWFTEYFITRFVGPSLDFYIYALIHVVFWIVVLKLYENYKHKRFKYE
ncbi:MAG: hypothetical protein CSB16_00845 [Clostridiales bacterium]|nr:MAG: hypothetical protein CSB16_00845 [Clostridiales bacterium]